MFDDINPLTIEKDLAEQLQGLGLIGELNLDPESDTYLAALSSISRLSRNGVARAAQLAPASLTVLLTADGRYRYEGGTFWPNCAVPEIAACSGIDQKRIYESFTSYLESIGIESFGDDLRENGQQYQVQSMLMQGGVPNYCAGDLWKLLGAEIDSGNDEIDRIFSRWRQQLYSLRSVDVPVQNFIRWGGEQATDLVSRMIDVLISIAPLSRQELEDMTPSQIGTEHGLPAYLIESLISVGVSPVRKSAGPRLPRPRIFIDSSSGDGPFVELPAVREVANGRWTVLDKTQRSIATSRAEIREQELNPADVWMVTLSTDDTERKHTFAQSSRANVYLFDEDGELLASQDRVVGRYVHVLAPATTTFTDGAGAAVPSPISLPPLSGAWSAWTLTLLDCEGLTGVTIREREDQSARLPVREGLARPVLVGPSVPNVSMAGGERVFSAMPNIQIPESVMDPSRWRVRLRPQQTSDANEVSEWCSFSDLSNDNNEFDIRSLVNTKEGFVGRVEVRGPLGSDLNESVAVVPGLMCDVPDRLVLPNETVTGEISADGNVFEDNRSGTTFEFVGYEGEPVDSVRVVAHVDGVDVDLVVRCSRLMWATKRLRSSTAFSAKVEVLSVDDLKSGDVQALTIRTRTEELVALVFRAGDLHQETFSQRTVGVEGKWSFPLHEFSSTILASNEPFGEFFLRVRDVEVPVARIAVQLAVKRIDVESIVDSESDMVLCSVRWEEEHRLRHRVLRLWSDTRPWEAPIKVPIPDDAIGELTFVVDQSLKAGWYIAQVDVEVDGWGASAKRPRRESSNSKLSQIGTKFQYLQHEKAIAAGSAVERLEYEFTDIHHNLNSLENWEAPGLFDELFESLIIECHEISSKSFDSRRIDRIIDLLLSDQVAFLKWAVDHASPYLNRWASVAPSLLIGLASRLRNSGIEVEFELQRRLWLVAPQLGAAVTNPTESLATAELWLENTGWPIIESELSSDGAEELNACWQSLDVGQPIFSPLDKMDLKALQDIRLAYGGREVRVLAKDGHFDCMFDFLEYRLDSAVEVEHWLQNLPSSARTGSEDAEQLSCGPQFSNWCNFPKFLHRLAEIGVQSGLSNLEVIDAINEASALAESLTARAQLLVLAQTWKGP